MFNLEFKFLKLLDVCKKLCDLVFTGVVLLGAGNVKGCGSQTVRQSAPGRRGKLPGPVSGVLHV